MRTIAKLLGTLAGVTIGSVLTRVAPSKPPKGVLTPGSSERSCTPVCEAIFDAVFGDVLDDWAREIAFIDSDVVDEWAEGAS